VNDRYGVLAIEGEHAVMTFVRRLPYPVEAVWAAITDPDERAAWFGETTIDGRAGGRIEMVASGPPASEERRRMSGRILVWDPPHVLEHEWQQLAVEDSVVRYELTPDGDGTLLRFSHRGLGVDPGSGWISGSHAFLDRLEAHVAGVSLPDWQQRALEVLREYERRRAGAVT
jgi:uncharacterized protein YndB with AHSA1/START domain